MNLANHIRTGDDQDVVVSFQVPSVGGKTFPAKIFLRQLMTLNHRSHRPIHQHNPLGQRPFQLASSAQNSFLYLHPATLTNASTFVELYISLS